LKRVVVVAGFRGAGGGGSEEEELCRRDPEMLFSVELSFLEKLEVEAGHIEKKKPFFLGALPSSCCWRAEQ
jgi:hypothetical protein